MHRVSTSKRIPMSCFLFTAQQFTSVVENASECIACCVNMCISCMSDTKKINIWSCQECDVKCGVLDKAQTTGGTFRELNLCPNMAGIRLKSKPVHNSGRVESRETVGPSVQGKASKIAPFVQNLFSRHWTAYSYPASQNNLLGMLALTGPSTWLAHRCPLLESTKMGRFK